MSDSLFTPTRRGFLTLAAGAGALAAAGAAQDAQAQVSTQARILILGAGAAGTALSRHACEISLVCVPWAFLPVFHMPWPEILCCRSSPSFWGQGRRPWGWLWAFPRLRAFFSSCPLARFQTWWAEEPAMWCIHSPEWWRRHWERSGIVDVELADTMPDGWQYWLKWHRSVAPDNLVEIDAVETDRGDYLGYVRVIGRRRPNVHLDDPIVSVPSEYVQKPLLRELLY